MGPYANASSMPMQNRSIDTISNGIIFSYKAPNGEESPLPVLSFCVGIERFLNTAR